MRQESLVKEVELTEGLQADVAASKITIKGPKGEVTRTLRSPKVAITATDGKVTIQAKNPTKREKKLIHTYAAHVRNMCKGVQQGHKYVLKICSGHFPMNVSVNGDEIIVKNFIGEKVPRKYRFNQDVKVRVEGDQIIVEHTDKELAGQTAASIEQLTRRRGFDRRIFQDGIYITEKDGKEI